MTTRFSTKTGMLLLAIALLVSPVTAEQFNGGFGLQYVTSAFPLPHKAWQINSFSRAYAFNDPNGELNTLASIAAGFNYGWGRNFETEATVIVYQDVLNT